MLNVLCFLAILPSVYPSENTTIMSGKKYFFKMGRNNEYRMPNRILYLNHNITDDVNPHAKVSNGNTRLFETEDKSILNDSSPHFLDEEWNYNHRNLQRTVLPLFVRKFYEQSLESLRPKSTKRILFNENKNNSNDILYFNLKSIQPDETILDADLYFYWPLKNTSAIFKESIVLRLYQFEKHYKDDLNRSRMTENPDVHKLFNVIYVSKAQKGWQMFKVKKPIDNWLGGEENLGLLLTLSFYENNTFIEVFNDTNIGNLSTFIVVNVQKNGTETTRNATLPSSDHLPSNGKPDDIRKCRKQEWTIDFRHLGWNQFIIAPEFFSAFDCTGRCLIVRDDYNNHAKLVHNLQKRTTCCVPIDYRDLVVMYYDKYGNIAIKSYPDIVATECGCR